MSHKIFIDGEEGTTGLRLSTRLSLRDDIELLHIDSAHRKDIKMRMNIMSDADVVFLCLPDVGAKEIVNAIENDIEKNKDKSAFTNLKIIDSSTAHRVANNWTYGLPEIYKNPNEEYETTPVESAMRVCVPGCHATGFVVTMNPLINEGLINKDNTYSMHSLTGYSGGGKTMISDYKENSSEGLHSAPRQYALTQKHKHIPEMIQYTGLTHQPIFTPIVSNFYSGMLVSVSISSRDNKNLSVKKVYEALSRKYEGCKLIKVRELGYDPEGGFLSASALSGRDDLEIIVTGDDSVIEIISRYDNLGKGASGAAIQCMNRILGLPEEKGLVLGE